MDINLEILYLYKKVVHLNTLEEKKEFLGKAKKQDIKRIIDFWRHILIKQKYDEQMDMATRIVQQILTVFQKETALNNITIQEINGIAHYMEKTRKFQHLINIVDILFLERQIQIFSKNQTIFKTIVNNFQFLQNDEVRHIAVQNLTEMMKLNQQLLVFANNPYYFLEYLLQVINSEENGQKVIEWFKTMQKLFLFQNAQKHLFYQNDFRIFVDIIVRHIQNFQSQQSLITFLQTYLTLTLIPFIMVKGSLYKLDQIMIILNDTMTNNQAIRGYKKELQSLMMESK